MYFVGYKGVSKSSFQKQDYRLTLTKNIDHELDNEHFLSRTKNGSAGVFTRCRVLTCRSLILLVMSFQSSIQRDLDRFYKAISKSDFNIREVTKGALSQARKKLNSWGFSRLNEVAVESFYAEAEYYVWHGMRLLSVDGSTSILPNHPSVQEQFPPCAFGPQNTSLRSLGRISMLYDVLNHLALDARMDPFQVSERTQLQAHLNKVERGDLLLLDRGYPSFKLFFELHARGIEYCMRLNHKWWKLAKTFVESDQQDEIIQFSLPEKHKAALIESLGNVPEQLSIRLIKVSLPGGGTEVLATSLIDQQKYSQEDVSHLYTYRWNEEEAFKLLKARMDLADYSGKTVDAVLQDFHAKVFMLTLMAAYAHPIEERVRNEYKADQNRKYDQKINRTSALASLRDMLVPLFVRKSFEKSIQAFDELVIKTREIVRKDRHNPRNKRTKVPPALNYRRL